MIIFIEIWMKNTTKVTSDNRPNRRIIELGT